MHRSIKTVIRRLSGMPSSVVAWIDGASMPCSGELLAALETLWKRDPLGRDATVADARRMVLSAFMRAEQRERWIAERVCVALLARLKGA
jgi:hypothetical protein